MKALSILQPWAWLIANGYKDIDNRNWREGNSGLKFRGPFYIHAGTILDRRAAAEFFAGRHPITGERLPFAVPMNLADQCGGIVGEAEIVDCVTQSDSPWFVGPFGFVIRNARPLPFRACREAYGFFDPDLTDKVS